MQHLFNLKPNVNHIESLNIQCPKCNENKIFHLFYTNVSVEVASISVLPFNKKISAFCTGCNSLFTIKDETAEKFIQDRNIKIEKTDLIEKQKKDLEN